MDGKFYPAVFVGAYQSALEALASVGVVGGEAEFSLAGVVVGPDHPVVFEILGEDTVGSLGPPLSKSAVCRLARPRR